MARCATCWPDPVTRTWHNPGGHKVGGTAESNVLCFSCRKRMANWEWVETPKEEVYGIDAEFEDDEKPIPDSEPGAYETPLCIEIMKRYCLGQTQRAIATGLDIELKYVSLTVTHWKTQRGYFLETLKSMIRRMC